MPRPTIAALNLLLVLTACTQPTQPEAGTEALLPSTSTTPPATATQSPSREATTLPSPTAVPPTATSIPPTSTVTPTATRVPPTSTPDSVAGLTIPDFRAKRYGEGEITIGGVWHRSPGYTSYRIRYPVDGLQLTGLLHVPEGDGPFPLIIANRGTIARDIYQPGMDSHAFSNMMARNGYLVVAPDFRGYGGGDDGPNPFYTGYYADVLGLIPLAQKLPIARRGKVGMWGHSRGASVTVAALTVSDQIAAAVVYAPAPADLAVDYARRFRQSGGNPGSGTWPFPPNQNPAAYQRVSPITYIDAVSAPVMLHHGTADTTVDHSASTVLADTLRAAGKEVTLYLYEGDGHALRGSAYNLYAQRTIDFFRSHLGQ